MYTKTPITPPFGRVFAPAGRPCIRCKTPCTTCKKMHAVQPSESTQFGTNGGASSYKWGTPIINIWGTHCRTNGGCVSHPRRAHNLVQIIVCYNYHSAELRVRGLPKMALWYICTFVHLYICTLVHWYIWILVHLYLLFSPIVVQMGDAHYQHLGDALSYKWGDASIDALSRPSCAHYRTDGGRCHRSTFQSLLRPLSYRWGTLP